MCRGQVDLIVMQSASDGPLNWIMNYQDHHDKFCVLKALTHKCAKEVAANLIEIFLTFSAPGLLQSDNGREFVNKVIDELTTNVLITNHIYNMYNLLYTLVCEMYKILVKTCKVIIILFTMCTIKFCKMYNFFFFLY